MQEINLYDLLKYYLRNWLNLLSALLIGAIIGLVYTIFIQTPLYKSEATMLVVNSRTQDTTINNNYTELFRSRKVLQATMEKQGYSGSYEQLLSRTTATNDKNTDIIKVSIADTNPQMSQQLLSTALDTFQQEAKGIYDADNTNGNIKTVDTATLPSEPYNVNLPMQIGLAMAATFFLAIITLFFIYDYRSSQGTLTPQTPAKPAKKTGKSTSTTSKSENEPKPAKHSVLRGFAKMLVGDDTTSAVKVDKKAK